MRAELAEPDMHVFEDSRPAEEYALAADLQRCVRCKKIRQVVPLRLVHVVAVGILDDFHIGQILQTLDAPAESVQILLDGSQLTDALGPCLPYAGADRYQ